MTDTEKRIEEIRKDVAANNQTFPNENAKFLLFEIDRLKADLNTAVFQQDLAIRDRGKAESECARLREALELSLKAWDKAIKYFEEHRLLDEERARQAMPGADSNTRNGIYGANVWTTVQNEMEMLKGMINPAREALGTET